MQTFPWLLVALLRVEDLPPAVGETIVVEDARVARTRQALERDILDLGYTIKKERNGRTIYRPEDPWHPTIVVDEDGFMTIRRSPVRFAAAEGLSPFMRTASYVLCPIDWALCVRAGGQFVGPAKLEAKKGAVVERTAPTLAAWEEALRDRGLAGRLSALPDAIDRLWSEGVQIDHPEAPRLQTPAERKHALVEFWATRTDSPEGDEVKALVRDFLVYEVSASPWPVTDEDRGFARTRCGCEPDF